MRIHFTEDCTYFTDFRLMLVIIQTPGGGGGGPMGAGGHGTGGLQRIDGEVCVCVCGVLVMEGRGGRVATHVCTPWVAQNLGNPCVCSMGGTESWGMASHLSLLRSSFFPHMFFLLPPSKWRRRSVCWLPRSRHTVPRLFARGSFSLFSYFFVSIFF